jgi:predicted RecA/RadA family phage recombinase
MSEATTYKDADSIDVVVPAAGYASGEVIQLSDGRAAVRDGLRALVAGEQASLRTAGQFTLAKTASVVILEGDLVYWDRSVGTATPLRAVAGADFPVGTAVMDAASADTTVVVDLNKRPVYTIDLLRDPTDTVLVGSAALTMGPGYAKMGVVVTSEAEKVDVMSKHSIPVTIPFIVEWGLPTTRTRPPRILSRNLASSTWMARHSTSWLSRTTTPRKSLQPTLRSTQWTTPTSTSVWIAAI